MNAVPFAVFSAEVLALYSPPLRRAMTHAKMRRVLSEFASLGLATTAEITPSAIVRWLQSEHCKARRAITNRSYLATMRAATTIAKRMGWLDVSPWDVRKDWLDWSDLDETEEGPSTRPRHLTVEEIGRLLDQADREADRSGCWRASRLQALVYLYVYTGLRKSEALGLQTRDVDLGARTLTVRSSRRRRLKTRTSRRVIALHPDLVPVLARWIARSGSEWLFPCQRSPGPWLHGPAGAKALDQVRELATRAGLPHATIQALRRSLATHGRRWGWSQLDVQDLLGHGSVATQAWYLEDDLADQRAAIERIRYRPGPPVSDSESGERQSA